MSDIKYSVTVPVYNEYESLDGLVEKISKTMSSLEHRWELILVDDGSIDGSFEKMGELKNRYPELRALKFSKNNGQTAAMAAGIKASRGRIIITLDADLQNDPADIPLLLEKINEGYDAAVGWRIKRNDNFIRRLSSRFANAVRNYISDEDIKDTGCSLKAFKA
ncbi:MAG: glycosyltransferase family 2 protein, partial [Candidatus Rifleibacteriota bacterium]